MPKSTPSISKGKYCDGLRCFKLLWYKFNRKSAIPETDDSTQARFDQGNLVGDYSKKLYPDGIQIEYEWPPEKMQAKTAAALKLRKPLFEAGMLYGRAYAQPDILVPVEGNAWDLIEVKQSGKLKDEHLPDVAFQKYVYTGAGLKIRKCYLMHLDTKYVKNGEIEPKKLFTKVDVTAKIKPYEQGIEGRVKEMLEVIAGKEPVVKIGPQCSDPYGCPLEDLCWDYLPKKNIFQLWFGRGKKLFMLLDRGIMKLTDIPEDELNGKQLIQVGIHKTGEVHIDKEEIKEFLRQT